MHVLAVALGPDARHPVVEVAARRRSEEISALEAPLGNRRPIEPGLGLKARVAHGERQHEDARDDDCDRDPSPQAFLQPVTLRPEMSEDDCDRAQRKQRAVVQRAERDRRRDRAAHRRVAGRRRVEQAKQHEEAEREHPEQLELRMTPVRECVSAERERECRDDRSVIARREPLRQRVGGRLREHHEEQAREVERGDEAARDSVEQGVERRRRQQQVGVGEREGAGPEDRRVEEVQRVREQRVHVPRHDPCDQRRIAGVARQRVEHAIRRRASHEQHGADEEHTEQHGLEPPRPRPPRFDGRRSDLGDALVGLDAGDGRQRPRRSGPAEYRTMQYRARMPSFHPIFLPSAYVRPS